MTNNELKMLQALPLEVKVAKTKLRIDEWVRYWGLENVYVSFSGGKDSTVLLHIARQLYPDIKAVYVDTGLEYKELKDHVKTFDNVDIIRPKMSFREVLQKYGYPVISKEQSQYIQQYRNAKSEKTKKTRIEGNKWGRGKIALKHRYLLDAPFKISDQCCNIMKKNPAKQYEKETGRVPIIGTMADESSQRAVNYLKHGCNGFDLKRPHSTPIGFWTESDILQYIFDNNIAIPSVYGKVIKETVQVDLFTTKDIYSNTGVNRTGCMFCMFGVHLEKGQNRFQRMKETHPKEYDYCINNLGCGQVLDFIGVKY